jgi:tRNA(fMet)-specific endonuclease VapC
MICLDTNMCIAAMSDDASPVFAHLRACKGEGEPLAIPAIVLFELRYGIANSISRGRNELRLRTFLEFGFDILAFNDADAGEAAEIRAALRRAGTPIGPYDVLIAAQARCRSATIATANVREFVRVERLSVIDWSVPG